MKNVHIKQKLIVSALAGAIMIPGSAMPVHAAEASEQTVSPLPIAGIESVLTECYETNVKNNIELNIVPTNKGEYLDGVVSSVSGVTFFENAPKYEKTNVTVVADVLNVRSGQSTNFPILTQVVQNQSFEVSGEPVAGWYPIEANGMAGWVSGDWVLVEHVSSDGESESATVQDTVAQQTDAQNSGVPSDDAQETAASPASSIDGQTIIDFACQFIGNPYVWGGTSLTNGADCSGFVQSVYANFGISLPRTTWDMENVGQEVSYEQAQPGDLVLYDGHVGLYMGDGNIVNAMNENDGIGICSATYAPIITVRRVL